MTGLNDEELDALADKWFKKKIKRHSVIIEIGKDKNCMQVYRLMFADNISKATMFKRLMRYVVRNFIYSKAGTDKCLMDRSKGFIAQTGRLPDMRDRVHIEYLAKHHLQRFRRKIRDRIYYDVVIECCPVIDKLYDKVTV